MRRPNSLLESREDFSEVGRSSLYVYRNIVSFSIDHIEKTTTYLSIAVNNNLTLNCVFFSVITRLEIKDCDIWFIRFALDFWKETLALGNKSGKTYLYDLKVAEPSQIRASVLSHPKCISPIRQTAFSRDGSVLICVCDDATIWRWDINKDVEEEVDK